MATYTSYDWIEIDHLPNGGVSGGGLSENYVTAGQPPEDGVLISMVEPVSWTSTDTSLGPSDTVTLGGTVYTVTSVDRANVDISTTAPSTITTNLFVIEIDDGAGDVRQFFVPLDTHGNIGEISSILVTGYSAGTSIPTTFIDENFNVTLVCFAAGTRIETPDGERAIETLCVGDLVTTLDRGPQPVRWIGRTHVGPAALARNPKLRPVSFAPGSLAPGVPERRLSVSPQHRILLRSRVAGRMFGSAEILTAAKNLLGLPGVTVQAPEAGVTYFHLLLDRNEILRADGAGAESLLTGPQALLALDQDARAEIAALMPAHAPVPARTVPKARGVRTLCGRLLKNARPAIEAHG